MTPLEKELVEALENLSTEVAKLGFRVTSWPPLDRARSLLARAKQTGTRPNGHDMRCPYPGYGEVSADCVCGDIAESERTREFTVTDDGHGRAMVGGRRLAYGEAGVGIGDWLGPTFKSARVFSGTRVRVELRDGCDFATLVEVLP